VIPSAPIAVVFARVLHKAQLISKPHTQTNFVRTGNAGNAGNALGRVPLGDGVIAR
jgi:hypothetical protein